MQKKLIIFIFTILILLISTISVGCVKDTENTFYFPGSSETGNINDLTLTIYQFNLFLSRPMTFEEFTSLLHFAESEQLPGLIANKVIVHGEKLIEHRDLINKLFAMELKPTETETTVSAHLYYVFEHKEYGELFSFLAYSQNGNVFVNGIEVARDSIFFKTALLFLPERTVR